MKKMEGECDCIRILHTSLYFHGDGYERVFIVFSASFKCIDAKTSEGNSLTCGIGSKTSLKSDLSFFSHFNNASLVAKSSICSHIALATLKSSTISG